LKEALYWEPVEEGAVRCRLCPNMCVIAPGKYGICNVRYNRDGCLYSENYGRVTSIGLDPVEKKPLYHFHPGGLLLSIGTYGCNLRCKFCQNWQISQMKPPYYVYTPEDIVKITLSQKKRYSNTVGISYTYNEPTVWYEFVSECAQLGKSHGLCNVLVTNGYIAKEPLSDLLPFVDALNVDVKAWDDDFYRRMVGGRLAPVLETVEQAYASGAWVEVTYLVIPGENDSDEDMKGLADWLSSISPTIPLHLSRFFPAYQLDLPPTPLSSLERLKEVARESLYYVYIGNAIKEGYGHTFCPNCGELLLARSGLQLRRSFLADGLCPTCGRALEFAGQVWV